MDRTSDVEVSLEPVGLWGARVCGRSVKSVVPVSDNLSAGTLESVVFKRVVVFLFRLISWLIVPTDWPRWDRMTNVRHATQEITASRRKGFIWKDTSWSIIWNQSCDSCNDLWRYIATYDESCINNLVDVDQLSWGTSKDEDIVNIHCYINLPPSYENHMCAVRIGLWCYVNDLMIQLFINIKIM